MKNPIKVYCVSLGCPKNRVDVETMLGCVAGGVEVVAAPESADVVVINTCSFIAPAVEESVRTIGEPAEAVRDLSPRPQLAVTGACRPATGRNCAANSRRWTSGACPRSWTSCRTGWPARSGGGGGGEPPTDSG
jgi:tRNA A37 methylthiotransferase MiaB